VNVDVKNAVDMSETKVNEPTEVVPHEPLVEPLLRRSVRERHHSQKYSPHEFVLLTNEGKPECYEEAMLHEEKNKWLKAMQEEMKSLHKNHTFELVKLR